MTPKELQKNYNRDYYLAHKAEIVAQHREYRATAEGKAMRRREKANRKKKHPEKMRAEWAKYEKSESRRKYLNRKRDHRNEKNREYRAANRSELNKKHREWYVKNRPAQLAKNRMNRVRLVQANREWRKNNPELSKLNHLRKYHRRRARSLNVTTPADKAALHAKMKAIRLAVVLPCRWCNVPTVRGNRHIDHIIPLVRGGLHSADNLCCACPSCNCTKQGMMPDDFIRMLRSKQKHPNEISTR
jgi:hypothetical protein